MSNTKFYTLIILCISIIFLSFCITAKAQTKVSVSYSNLRADKVIFLGTNVPITESHNIIAEVNTTIYHRNKFSIQPVFEFSTNFNNRDNVKSYSYHAGGQLTYSPNDRVDIFGKVLFGAYRVDCNQEYQCQHFSHLISSGVDFHIGEYFFIRPIEVGRVYVNDFPVPNTRISAGIGLRFGK